MASLGQGPRAELMEVLPPQLEDAGRGARRRAAAVREVLGAGPKTFRLRADVDNKWREACEWTIMHMSYLCVLLFLETVSCVSLCILV